ncbi:hypothetical protein ACCO45_011214 [Purpureocillium lilacinum]|uniref:Uncharacterized protein n=1 Tax=Purpureocillium lilacinum TaxID=33203 RepID=A0ACC4DGZ0_PURLI
MSTNGDAASLPRAESPTGSPRSASVSLQAAATVNAGLRREPSRQSSQSSLTRNAPSPRGGRRRSAVLMNLQLNDPSIPGPGEMAQEHSGSQRLSPQPLSGSPLTADPHHHRAPSLGELHQELEAEQEAHVNRLLQMIRQQQLELQRLQAGRPSQGQDTAAEDAASETRARPIPGASMQSTSQTTLPGSQTVGSVGSYPVHLAFRTLGALSTWRERTFTGDLEHLAGAHWVLGGRDESAFYQAETQMLIRENQMLKHRIRDLEKQLSEMSGPTASTEPPIPSHLIRSSLTADESEAEATAK